MMLNRLISSLRFLLLEPLVEILYPPFCILCDKGLTKEENRICTVCWSGFARIQHDDSAFADLKNKFKTAGVVDDCFSLFLFEKEGRLQEVLHLIKYGGFAKLGFQLGEEIGRGLKNEQLFVKADALVPVPLHSLKLRERGYNQSEYICRGISAITGVPVNTSSVKRVRFTATQTKLNITERAMNVSGAFKVPKSHMREVLGKNIILVDDVVTTGARINACARELRKNGANSIVSASVAHAF